MRVVQPFLGGLVIFQAQDHFYILDIQAETANQCHNVIFQRLAFYLPLWCGGGLSQ